MDPGILFVDDDADLRLIFSTLVTRSTGRNCLSLAGVDEMRANRDFVLNAALAILDINLGPDKPSGLDAYGWLRAEGFRGKIVFLTGHGAEHPLVERAARKGEALVYHKPLTAQQINDIVRSAL
jgi:FixJ family two-component response regulator